MRRGGFPDLFALLPWIYLVVGLAGALGFALLTPPLQVPDEGNHLFRAASVARGQVLPRPVQGKGGAELDAGLVALDVLFPPVDEAKGVRIDATRLAKGAQLRWAGHDAPAQFPNTAVYGPLPYLPQAAALAFARLTNLPLLQSLTAARAANAIAAVLVGFLALRACGRGRLALFYVLAMPMTLFLDGSASQDALLIAGFALLTALLSRRETAPDPWDAAALALVVVVMAWGRPPYLVFLLLLVGQAGPAGRRTVLALAALIAAAAWQLRVGAQYVDLRDGVSAARQLHLLLAEPARIAAVAAETLSEKGQAYAEQMVGVFGWADWGLWWDYYPIAWAGFALALVGEAFRDDAHAVVPRRPRPWRAGARLALAAALLLAAGGIFAGLYLTWTPVGHAIVDGVQGRYFLPMLPLLVFLLPRGRARPALARAAGIATVAIALAGAPLGIAAVMARYHPV